jgi:sensor domain CHASE-containing protein
MADSSAVAWSVHELGLADFGDKRLTQRGVELASSLLEHPQHSIPQACQSWAATKGAYRFFSNDKVQSGKMLNAHQVETIK